METTQVPQPSVFLPIGVLQQAFEFEGRANLLLLRTDDSAEVIQMALCRKVNLLDYKLTLEWLAEAKAWEIKSDRVFIDSDIGESLLGQLENPEPVTSYLVNGIRIGEHSTPY